MTTKALKEMLLQGSFGGVMYDVSEGSKLRQLVTDYTETARQLVAGKHTG
jgi:hypothetical protein